MLNLRKHLHEDNFLIQINRLFCSFVANTRLQEEYNLKFIQLMLKTPQFDIVIPVHKKDLSVLEYCIDAARKKIVGARRIITVSVEKYTDSAEWFPESQFPFSMDLARQYTGDSCGWYFQQLLKLYAPLVIPDIAENVLILDSDTVFFRQTKMFDRCGRPFYNISKDTKICRKPFDIAVEDHINKLWPAISREHLPAEFNGISGVCHSMMFNRKIISELFEKVEKYDKEGDKFFKIFLKYSNYNHGASEYQIYFNFLLIFHSKEIAIRKLKYKNTADLNIQKYRKRLKYSYCSFHSYLRKGRTNSARVKCENFFKKIWQKLFEVEQWNIGVAQCNISQFLKMPNQKIKWLKNTCLGEFRADSFGLMRGDKKFIFFEKYDRVQRKGKISVLEINQNLDILSENDVLEEKHHLSYPYIFSHKEKNYALVESHRAKELSLYEILENQQLKKIKVILNDVEVIDPSIIFYENKFWLFFSIASEANSKLCIAYSDELLGEWKMHPKNPVKDDISSARSAGEIFEHEGFLYRPAQNCLRSYGAAITINKITQLTTAEFAETEETEITPNQLGQYPLGLHNIASLGKNLTVIDGKKRFFVPHKMLVYLIFKAKKFFIKSKIL